jgi:O-antigen/teichoic acid export membrane protein
VNEPPWQCEQPATNSGRVKWFFMVSGPSITRVAKALDWIREKEASFFVYLLTRVIAAVCGLLVVRFLIALLDKAQYGEWGVFFAVSQVLVPAFSLSVPAAMMRLYFDYGADERRARATVVTTAFHLTWLGIVLLALSSLAAWLPLDCGTSAILYFALVSTGSILLAFFNTLARTRDDYGVFFFNLVTDRAGFLLLLAVGTWYVSQGAPAGYGEGALLLAVMLLAVSRWFVNVVNMIFYVSRRAIRPLAVRIRWAHVAEILRFSAPIALALCLASLLRTTDIVLLSRLASREAAADYCFANSIVAFVGLISISALTDWPRFYYSQMTGKRDDRDIRITRRVQLFLWLHVGAMLVLRIAAPAAYRIYGAEAYLSGIDCVYYLLLADYFLLLGELLGAGVSFAKKTHLLLLRLVVAGTINVLLNLWLIPIGGPKAAALTTVASYAVFALLSCSFGQRYYRFQERRRLLWPTAVALPLALLPLGDVLM